MWWREGGARECREVMKIKFFTKIQQLSLLFQHISMIFLTMADWLFNFSTFSFSIYGSFQFSDFRFLDLVKNDTHVQVSFDFHTSPFSPHSISLYLRHYHLRTGALEPNLLMTNGSLRPQTLTIFPFRNQLQRKFPYDITISTAMTIIFSGCRSSVVSTVTLQLSSYLPVKM